MLEAEGKMVEEEEVLLEAGALRPPVVSSCPSEPLIILPPALTWR